MCLQNSHFLFFKLQGNFSVYIWVHLYWQVAPSPKIPIHDMHNFYSVTWVSTEGDLSPFRSFCFPRSPNDVFCFRDLDFGYMLNVWPLEWLLSDGMRSSKFLSFIMMLSALKIPFSSCTDTLRSHFIQDKSSGNLENRTKSFGMHTEVCLTLSMVTWLTLNCVIIDWKWCTDIHWCWELCWDPGRSNVEWGGLVKSGGFGGIEWLAGMQGVGCLFRVGK